MARGSSGPGGFIIAQAAVDLIADAAAQGVDGLGLDVRTAVVRGPHQPLSIGQNTRVVDLGLRRSTCSLAPYPGRDPGRGERSLGPSLVDCERL